MSKTTPVVALILPLLPVPPLFAQTASPPMPDASFDIDGTIRVCNTINDCLFGISPDSQVECIVTPGDSTGVCYVHRNRYISIDPNPSNAGIQTARRVLLDLGGGQTALLGWVSQPVPAAVLGPEPSPQYVSRIVDVPYYGDWSAVAGGETVHVGDCETTPDHTYIVQAIASGADIDIESNYSAPLALATVEFFADVTGGSGRPPNRALNFIDVQAIFVAIDGLQMEPVAWLDLAPEVPDFAITQQDVDALPLFPNPEPGPPPYPDPLACTFTLSPPLPEASFDITISCNDNVDCGGAAGTACIDGICYAMKNRYLSVDPNPANAGLVTARRVSLYPGGVDPPVLGWVGEPVEVKVGGEPRAQLLARIVDAPYYRNWNLNDAGQPWGDATVHIGDCETSPGHVYVIQSIIVGADIGNEANYSAFLPLPTVTDFGDVVGPDVGTPPDGIRNFRDINAVVKGFQGVQTEPRTWLDLRGGSTTLEIPDFGDINFYDINSAVAGFQGEDYPYCRPLDCANAAAECHP